MMEEQKKKEGTENEKLTIKEAFTLGPVFGYFFRKKDPNRPKNFNLKVMHGINKLSIIMFLIALTVMIVRHFTR